MPNELLLAPNHTESIPDHLYKQLRSSGGLTPLLYGLLKIHKPEVPLRAIASFINSPSYQLSKHLVHLLSPLVGKTPSFTKNSADLADMGTATISVLEQPPATASADGSPGIQWLLN